MRTSTARRCLILVVLLGGCSPVDTTAVATTDRAADEATTSTSATMADAQGQAQAAGGAAADTETGSAGAAPADTAVDEDVRSSPRPAMFVEHRWGAPGRWAVGAAVPAAWDDTLDLGASTWAPVVGPVLVRDDGASGTPCRDEGGFGQVDVADLDGPDGTVAITNVCLYEDDGSIAGFSMQFDAAEDWRLPEGYDLLGVAVHEFGHALGWEGHHDSATCAASVSTMCAVPDRGSTAWRVPTPRDTEPLATAYGR